MIHDSHPGESRAKSENEIYQSNSRPGNQYKTISSFIFRKLLYAKEELWISILVPVPNTRNCQGLRGWQWKKALPLLLTHREAGHEGVGLQIGLQTRPCKRHIHNKPWGQRCHNFTFKGRVSWNSISRTSKSCVCVCMSVFFFFFLFMATPAHMEVPGLGVESQLQLPAYTTAVATPDLSCICDLHHSLWQCQILNAMSEARDQTHSLTETTLGP